MGYEGYGGAFGAVEGRIDPLRGRDRLSFTLHDALDNQPVFCLLCSDQAQLVRDAWGQRVIVAGWVKRDPATGRAVEINPVERIDILPEVVPGSYRRARAIMPANPGDPAPEVIIRRLRDE